MRIDQITFTRFLAAIIIVVFHFGENSFPFNNEVFKPFLEQASAGVSYFFILSGFVMIIAYGKSGEKEINAKKYYTNRFARIYPIYFIAILLSAIVLIIKNKDLDFYAFFLNIFALQSLEITKTLDINYTAWSVSVEAVFFLVFPLLYNYVYSRYSMKVVTGIGLFIFIISQALFLYAMNSSLYQGFPSISHNFLYYHPIWHINEFIIGNVAGLLFLKYLGKDSYKKNYYTSIILCGFVLVAMLHYEFANCHSGLLAVVFIPFIILLSLNTGKITRLFSLPICKLSGEISYGIYILQIPVYQACKFIFLKLNINAEKYSLFYIALVVLLCCAYLSYVYIETPLRKIFKRKKNGSGT